MAQLLPAAGVALLVGPLAERRSPAVVLVGGYAVQALGWARPRFSSSPVRPPSLVYVGAVVAATAIATTRPAQSALVPALTSEADQLTACNVVIGWVENLSLLVAGVATGVALTFGSVGTRLRRRRRADGRARRSWSCRCAAFRSYGGAG